MKSFLILIVRDKVFEKEFGGAGVRFDEWNGGDGDVDDGDATYNCQRYPNCGGRERESNVEAMINPVGWLIHSLSALCTKTLYLSLHPE